MNARWDMGEIDRQLAGVIRFGNVIEVDPANARVRCSTGGLETDWMPWASGRAGGTKHWSCPTVGEQVGVFAPYADPTQGFVVLGFFSDDNPAPSDDPDKEVTLFPDGTVVEYDSAANELTVTVAGAGKVTVNCKEATVNADTKVELATPLVHCTQALTVDGLITGNGGMAISGGSGATASITGSMNVNGAVSTTGTLTNNGKNVGSTHTHTAQGATAVTTAPN